ncbi:unnamed protein product [Bemisia tabaci]|uniref:SUEL-type lectin domain-containing protein n=1 Tax=Bemisia tabaci TaxID=7038 RepID=A0A9P0EZ15_BEMTA|nr:unnamed protein product [Bemisia tabaci]
MDRRQIGAKPGKIKRGCIRTEEPLFLSGGDREPRKAPPPLASPAGPPSSPTPPFRFFVWRYIKHSPNPHSKPPLIFIATTPSPPTPANSIIPYSSPRISGSTPMNKLFRGAYLSLSEESSGFFSLRRFPTQPPTPTPLHFRSGPVGSGNGSTGSNERVHPRGGVSYEAAGADKLKMSMLDEANAPSGFQVTSRPEVAVDSSKLKRYFNPPLKADSTESHRKDQREQRSDKTLCRNDVNTIRIKSLAAPNTVRSQEGYAVRRWRSWRACGEPSSSKSVNAGAKRRLERESSVRSPHQSAKRMGGRSPPNAGACENRRSCSFNVSQEIFDSDPCPDTSKYLEAHYNCLGAHHHSSPARHFRIAFAISPDFFLSDLNACPMEDVLRIGNAVFENHPSTWIFDLFTESRIQYVGPRPRVNAAKMLLSGGNRQPGGGFFEDNPRN